MSKFKSFMTDEDGFSARDFIMVLFIGVYIIEQAAVFIMSLFASVNTESLTIITTLDNVVMTIIGGLFGVQIAKAFKGSDTIEVTIGDAKDEGYEEKG